MKFTSPAALAAQIAQLEERLGALRRLQGAMTGGLASGSARQQRRRFSQAPCLYARIRFRPWSQILRRPGRLPRPDK